MRNRRRGVRKRITFSRNLTIFFLIAALAVSAGCFSAKYLVGPWLFSNEKSVPEAQRESGGKEPSTDAGKDKKESGGVISDGQDIEEIDPQKEKKEEETKETSAAAGGTADLYTIQYGSFTTKAAAEAEAARLKTLGIEVKTFEKDGTFKVVESPFESESAARSSLELRRQTAGEGAFITTVEADVQ